MVERGPRQLCGHRTWRSYRAWIVAGVPDLFVLHRGIAHVVEVKTPAGELSDPQQSVMAAVLASGGRVGVVRSAERCWGCSMRGAYPGRDG